MKDLSLATALAVCLLALAAGCQPKEQQKPDGPEEPSVVPVESVSLDPADATLEIGSTLQLEAVVLPENASDKSVSFSSLKPAVATVDDNGLVTAVALGETDIYVFAGDQTSSCHIKVKAQPKYAVSAVIKAPQKALKRGDVFTLELETEPYAIDEEPNWKSSNEAIATVDRDGTVTAVDGGYVTISAEFRDCKAECEIFIQGAFVITQTDASKLSYTGSLDLELEEPICVARGEVASIQMIISANDNVTSLKPEALYFCLDGVKGGMAVKPRMYWERPVYCTRYWNDWQGGAPGDEINPSDRMFPDALMPIDKWNVSLSKGQKYGLWMDFYIPRDIEPGLYCGSVLVSGQSNGRTEEVYKEFQVRVYPVTLPEEQSLAVINWTQGDFGAIAEPGMGDFLKKEEVAIKFMNDYGQNCWRLREGYYVAPYVKDGKLTFNFEEVVSNWERIINLCPKVKQIHAISMCDRTDHHLWCRCWYVNDSGELDSSWVRDDDPLIMQYFPIYFKALAEELAKHRLPNGRTWLESYAIAICDEPFDDDVEAYANIARAIKTGCRDLKIIEATCTTKLDPEYYDYICPQLDDIWKEGFQARNGQTQWMYTCLRPQGNLANRLFGMPLIKTRYVHWCNFYWKAEGYLHWGLQYWNGVSDESGNYDAYGDAYGRVRMETSPGGDNYIIYPGPGEVYPSLRLCNMRDGINDYELLKMIEAKDPGKAWEFCWKVIYKDPVGSPAPSNASADVYSNRYTFYDCNVAHFRQVRKEMLEFLSE